MTDQSPPIRAALTPERVLDAAVALADAEGLERLSMRRLAQALGVEAMSLYNHVAGKEALFDGMVERVVAEMAVPRPGGDWRDEMRRRAQSMRDALRRHPWAALLIISRINTGPAMLAHVDATLGCLLDAGFNHEMADRAWNALDSHVYGFTLQELRFPFAPKDFAAAAEAFLPTLPAETYPHLRALSETIIAGRYDGIHDFAFGLGLIIDGLQETLRQSRRHPEVG